MCGSFIPRHHWLTWMLAPCELQPQTVAVSVDCLEQTVVYTTNTPAHPELISRVTHLSWLCLNHKMAVQESDRVVQRTVLSGICPKSY